MFERYTDQARRAVVIAQDEAQQLRHDEIRTEHLLLGLLREDNYASQAMALLGISAEHVEDQIREFFGTGEQEVVGHIPFTPNAKQVLELALRVSLEFGHHYIGPEHLLLGIVRLRDSGAIEVLSELGIDEVSQVQEQVLELMRNPPEPEEDSLSEVELAASRLIEQLDSLPQDQRVTWLAGHALYVVGMLVAALWSDMSS